MCACMAFLQIPLYEKNTSVELPAVNQLHKYSQFAKKLIELSVFRSHGKLLHKQVLKIGIEIFLDEMKCGIFNQLIEKKGSHSC